MLHWAGKLWALHESGLPYEMDPRSLDTVGESHGPGGTIEGNGPLAAHYRVTTEADGSKRWVPRCLLCFVHCTGSLHVCNCSPG